MCALPQRCCGATPSPQDRPLRELLRLADEERTRALSHGGAIRSRCHAWLARAHTEDAVIPVEQMRAST